MIVCPSCNHQNPEGSIQCERCYTLLPTTAPCPNCGASVQSDATFCGQCGFNLQADQVAKQDNGLTNPFSFLEEDTEDLSLDNTIPTVVGNTPIVSPWDEEESEDITLGQPMSDDDTEIMNPYASSLESETPLNLDLPKTEKMPWEISNSELNSEISELLDLNTSELKIPDIPEVDAINLDENGEAPELPEMGIPELDLSQEAPELPEMGIPELDLSQEAPELPEMDTSELEVSAEIPELPEMDTSELEVSAEIPELPEMDTSELEVSAEIPELPEMDTSELEVSAEIPELPEMETAEPLGLAGAGLGSAVGASVTQISSATQLQIQQASLLHVQTSTLLEIAQDLDVIHLGKPNNQIPPDIDVSGFPNSEVVSRIHADIRVEGDTYFIEDVGSSNGTYINHVPLLRGNRHRLRTGDRISLGKGDLVTFIFQIK